MLKFLSRTVYTKDYVRQLHVACAVPFRPAQFNPGDGSVSLVGACYFCLYRSTWTNYDTWLTCVNKHGCNEGRHPFCKMMQPINDEVETDQPEPGGNTIDYYATGIFRQVMFEGAPCYIQLYVATGSTAKCNASCWWHAWRLNNKRTWRQCSTTHQCMQDGSLWVLMTPSDPILRNLFLQNY